MDVFLQKNKRLQLYLHIAIWVFGFFMHAFIFFRYYPLSLAFLRAFINITLLAVLYYVNFYLVYKFLFKNQYTLFFIATFILLLAILYIRTEVNTRFPTIHIEQMLKDPADRWFFGALFTNLSMWCLSMVYAIYHRRMQMEDKQKEIQNEQNLAHLQFLRAQINPHFLFNTLNNIYSLAMVKSDQTAEMVLRLSNLLRYVIYEGKREKVQLDAEVKQIEEYIALFQMKSEFPLDIRFEVEGQLDEVMLEPMILIPLVENCLKHCDFETNDKAFVQLSLNVTPHELRLQTHNSKDDQNQQKDKVGGVGLENIQRRLSLKYPRKHDLKIDNQKDAFFVSLQIQLT